MLNCWQSFLKFFCPPPLFTELENCALLTSWIWRSKNSTTWPVVFLDGSKNLCHGFLMFCVILEIKKDYCLVVPIKYILVLATHVFFFHYKKSWLNYCLSKLYSSTFHLILRNISLIKSMSDSWIEFSYSPWQLDKVILFSNNF